VSPADKYAAFIWPAYAITVVVFVWMILDAGLRARRWRRRFEETDRPDTPDQDWR